MKVVAVSVLLSAVLGTSAFTPHSPILIRSDQDFAVLGAPNIVQGVRSGGGMPDDPFVITDWTIAALGATRNEGCCTTHAIGIPAIEIRGTTAHLDLKRNLVWGAPGDVRALGLGRPALGIQVRDARNIVIDFLHLSDVFEGMVIVNSSNITLRHVKFDESPGDLGIARSSVTIEKSDFRNGTLGLNIVDSAITVRDSNFGGHSRGGVLIARTVVPIDLRGNWWGMPTGPNSHGADRVEGPDGGYIVSPWLTEPVGDAGFSP